MVISLEDLSLPGVAPYARLTEAQLRSRQCPEKGLFIAEGGVVIEAALEAGLTPVSLLAERRLIEGGARELLLRCGDIPVYTGESALLAQLTGFPMTRGLLAAFRRPEEKRPESVLPGARRLAVLEGIGDPSNLGTIFRSAAALGMDAVLLSPDCCDPFYRKALRTSMGAVLRIPWARFEQGWPGAVLEDLRSRGFLTCAMALRPEARSIRDIDGEKIAVLLGNEGKGLSQAAIDSCDRTVLLPMSHGMDSLNVAAAAAIAFWELGKA